jgi:hypothetical protein
VIASNYLPAVTFRGGCMVNGHLSRCHCSFHLRIIEKFF